ncbi:Nuclear pore complex protein Nup214 [Trichoplax sp. H2]|nr:Nuclear pore complex protein Nup214 [Trichoplax sp. H2]|eukprot:RDD43438.1 Nuclear pore complex protein Nup214 [Trichoplax sp. H2]
MQRPKDSITFLAISADGEILAVCMLRDKIRTCIGFAKVGRFRQSNITQNFFAGMSLCNEDGLYLVDCKWNPGTTNNFATCLSDGSVSVYAFDSNWKNIQQTWCRRPNPVATAICWSPKGTQLLIGDAHGNLTLYKLTDEPAQRQISCGLKTPHKVTDVLWFSGHVFMIIYMPVLSGNEDDSDESPSLVVIDTPKNAAPKITDFEDTYFGMVMEEKRVDQFFISNIKEWDLAISASANAMEVTTIGEFSSGCTWWDLADGSRAEVPIDFSSNADAFPAGLSFDFSSNVKLSLGEDRQHPACPIMLMITDHGVLHGYYLINEKQGAAPNIIKTIKQFNPDDIKDNVISEDIEARLNLLITDQKNTAASITATTLEDRNTAQKNNDARVVQSNKPLSSSPNVGTFVNPQTKTETMATFSFRGTSTQPAAALSKPFQFNARSSGDTSSTLTTVADKPKINFGAISPSFNISSSQIKPSFTKSDESSVKPSGNIPVKNEKPTSESFMTSSHYVPQFGAQDNTKSPLGPPSTSASFSFAQAPFKAQVGSFTKAQPDIVSVRTAISGVPEQSSSKSLKETANVNWSKLQPPSQGRPNDEAKSTPSKAGIKLNINSPLVDKAPIDEQQQKLISAVSTAKQKEKANQEKFARNSLKEISDFIQEIARLRLRITNLLSIDDKKPNDFSREFYKLRDDCSNCHDTCKELVDSMKDFYSLVKQLGIELAYAKNNLLNSSNDLDNWRNEEYVRLLKSRKLDPSSEALHQKLLELYQSVDSKTRDINERFEELWIMSSPSRRRKSPFVYVLDTIKKAINDNYDLLIKYDEEIEHILSTFKKCHRDFKDRNEISNNEHFTNQVDIEALKDRLARQKLDDGLPQLTGGLSTDKQNKLKEDIGGQLLFHTNVKATFTTSRIPLNYLESVELEDKRYQRYESTKSANIKTSSVGIQTEVCYDSNKQDSAIDSTYILKGNDSISFSSEPEPVLSFKKNIESRKEIEDGISLKTEIKSLENSGSQILASAAAARLGNNFISQESTEKTSAARTMSSNIPSMSFGENAPGLVAKSNSDLTSSSDVVGQHKQPSLSSFNFGVTSKVTSPSTTTSIPKFNIQTTSAEPASTSVMHSTFSFSKNPTTQFTDNSISPPKPQFNFASKETAGTVYGQSKFLPSTNPTSKSSNNTATPKFTFGFGSANTTQVSQSSSKATVNFDSNMIKETNKTELQVSENENKTVNNPVTSSSAFKFSLGSGADFPTSTVPSTCASTTTGTLNFQFKTAKPHQSTNKDDNTVTQSSTTNFTAISLSSNPDELKSDDVTEKNKNAPEAIQSPLSTKAETNVTSGKEISISSTSSANSNVAANSPPMLQTTSKSLSLATTATLATASVTPSVSLNSAKGTGTTATHENVLPINPTLASVTVSTKDATSSQFSNPTSTTGISFAPISTKPSSSDSTSSSFKSPNTVVPPQAQGTVSNPNTVSKSEVTFSQGGLFGSHPGTTESTSTPAVATVPSTGPKTGTGDMDFDMEVDGSEGVNADFKNTFAGLGSKPSQQSTSTFSNPFGGVKAQTTAETASGPFNSPTSGFSFATNVSNQFQQPTSNQNTPANTGFANKLRSEALGSNTFGSTATFSGPSQSFNPNSFSVQKDYVFGASSSLPSFSNANQPPGTNSAFTSNQGGFGGNNQFGSFAAQPTAFGANNNPSFSSFSNQNQMPAKNPNFQSSSFTQRRA